jgi:hypothetical protein
VWLRAGYTLPVERAAAEAWLAAKQSLRAQPPPRPPPPIRSRRILIWPLSGAAVVITLLAIALWSSFHPA